MTQKRSSLTARNSSIQAAMVAAGGGQDKPVRKAAPKPSSEPTHTKAVGLSVRLTPDLHDALRRIAFERRVSIHSLLLEGVNFVIQKHQP